MKQRTTKPRENGSIPFGEHGRPGVPGMGMNQSEKMTESSDRNRSEGQGGIREGLAVSRTFIDLAGNSAVTVLAILGE